MAEIRGGCLCGKVRYTTNADPIFAGVCHCHDCQKFTGAPFGAVVAVPKAALSLTGELTTFTKDADSGQSIHRLFCPVCGSSVLDEAAVMPEVVMLSFGTLDDPSSMKPVMQIYCDSAQPWVQLGGELKSFPKMPGQ